MGGFWEGLESVFGGELILNLNVELISNRNACESANVRELARVPVQNQFHDAGDGDDGDVRARTSTHGRRACTYVDAQTTYVDVHRRMSTYDKDCAFRSIATQVLPYVGSIFRSCDAFFRYFDAS